MTNSIEIAIDGRQDRPQLLMKVVQARDNRSMKRSLTDSVTLNSVDKKYKEIDPEDQRLKETTKEFEKILVSYMIKEMSQGIPKDEDSEGSGSEMYMEMAQTALAGEVVSGGGLGIAKMLYEQISKKNKKGQEASKDNGLLSSINQKD